MLFFYSSAGTGSVIFRQS